MKANTFRRRVTAILCSLLVGLSWAVTTVFAVDNGDIEQNASLTVYFGKNGEGFADVEFSIYRIAEISQDGSYTLTGDFKNYPVNLENLTSSGWRALAQTLDAYAARDHLQSLQVKKTGQDGQVVFSGLSTGLYLVKGEQYEKEGHIYTPEAMLVSLPALSEDGGWSYHQKVSCKFDSTETSSEFVQRKVCKVWEDNGNQESRPKEILVQLLENGRVVDTVVLNEENHWQYTWENLKGSSKWQVAEAKTPEGYTVSVAQEGSTFIMTNTCPSDTPSRLPQTGMLWWPVPLLACAGLLFVVMGYILRRRHGESDGR